MCVISNNGCLWITDIAVDHGQRCLIVQQAKSIPKLAIFACSACHHRGYLSVLSSKHCVMRSVKHSYHDTYLARSKWKIKFYTRLPCPLQFECSHMLMHAGIIRWYLYLNIQIGHVNEYPIMHHFGIPRQYFWKCKWKTAMWECPIMVYRIQGFYWILVNACWKMEQSAPPYHQ